MAIKTVVINGKQVGIVDLDEVFERAKEKNFKSEEEIKDFILSEVKNKNYIPPSLERTYREELYEEFLISSGKRERKTSDTPRIRLYGVGCPRCEGMNRTILEVISEKNLAVDYQYVKDINEMKKIGIMASPSLIINDKLVSAGRVLTKREIEGLLTGLLKKGK